MLPDGSPCFYIKDLYGNTFQIIENKEVFIEQHRLTGGMAGAVIGVTDMERSLRFYKEVLGYDTVKCDFTGPYSNHDIMPEARKRCRRVILTAPERKGAFAELFGYSEIELVQALERTPRKIYGGRYWGDPGFIQICFDVTGMDAMKKFCAEKGHPFTVDSCPDGETFDMGDASGRFAYIEDPDGTLVELVETGKVPIVKKLGFGIDMTKRNPSKPLPKILFRLMGLVMKEKMK